MAEGWNNAYSSMTGVKRPTIFRFLDLYKKDESLARSNIIKCLAAKKAPSQKKKDADRDAYLKNAVLNYQNDVKKAAEAAAAAEEAARKAAEDDVSDSDDDMNAQAGAVGNQWTRDENSRDNWKKSPAMVLLSAVAHNTRL